MGRVSLPSPRGNRSDKIVRLVVVHTTSLHQVGSYTFTKWNQSIQHLIFTRTMLCGGPSRASFLSVSRKSPILKMEGKRQLHRQLMKSDHDRIVDEHGIVHCNILRYVLEQRNWR